MIEVSGHPSIHPSSYLSFHPSLLNIIVFITTEVSHRNKFSLDLNNLEQIWIPFKVKHFRYFFKVNTQTRELKMVNPSQISFKIHIYFCFLFFDHTKQYVVSQFPYQGLNQDPHSRPPHWKCGVLTTGLLKKSLIRQRCLSVQNTSAISKIDVEKLCHLTVPTGCPSALYGTDRTFAVQRATRVCLPFLS